jgi:hypothetical protein
MAVAALGLAVAPMPHARAAAPQIVDPALDQPAPWADLVGVELSFTQKKAKPYLTVAFTVSGEISAPSRNAMTGYTFLGKVGKCDLIVQWYAYPMAEPALPPGSAGSQCGETGKDLGGTFVIKGNTVTVTVPMQDMASKGAVKGATMTDLSAHTAPLEGLNNDDEDVLAMAGDSAVGTKPWVIG